MSPKKYTRQDFLNTLLSGIALGAFMMQCQTKDEQGIVEEYKTGNHECDWYHNEIINV